MTVPAEVDVAEEDVANAPFKVNGSRVFFDNTVCTLTEAFQKKKLEPSSVDVKYALYGLCVTLSSDQKKLTASKPHELYAKGKEKLSELLSDDKVNKDNIGAFMLSNSDGMQAFEVVPAFTWSGTAGRKDEKTETYNLAPKNNTVLLQLVLARSIPAANDEWAVL